MAQRLAYTTASQLRALFSGRGIRPKKSLGQNFLVDPNLLEVVAEAGELTPQDVVLEIGAGTGSLTEALAARCGQVVAVEKDELLCRIARDSLATLDNVRLIACDILDDTDAIAEAPRRRVSEALASGRCTHFKVVADLPYSAATAILTALMDMAPPPEVIVGTVQREVGERLTAAPGTKSYGFLTILVQSRAKVELLRKLPPWVYWPIPKVWSALVRIQPDRTAPPEVSCAVKEVAAALFGHRRKTAVNALLMRELARSREEAEAILRRAGLEPDRRADSVAVAEIAELAKWISAARRTAGGKR